MCVEGGDSYKAGWNAACASLMDALQRDIDKAFKRGYESGLAHQSEMDMYLVEVAGRPE